MFHHPTLTTILLLCSLPLHSRVGPPAWGQSATKSVQVGETQFTIPIDMDLELVAGEPLTTWPMLAEWDSHGRLLLVESGGVSKPIEEHNKKLLHRIVRLDDSNGDGHFDTRTVVAQDLPFTEGILCIGRDLLISAPPSIYRLIDEDHDGLYESRQVWFDGQTITGCANDLHGPYLGRDGWIYWCKGAFAEQHHELLSGRSLSSSAAHIFRRRLAGGAIEPVMTGGMDNPVGFAVTPEGERFFTSTFLHVPGQSPGLRDGIAHAVYGGLYGKEHRQVTDGHVRTGDLMPIMVELGAAAPSGLACLSSTRLLPQQSAGERTLVAALFNVQKVTAHRLQPTGASFEARNSELVVADRIDFHPTDILEDADGSLLIIDTGGWYDLCCPSSRVDQKTAAGGIYRLSASATSAHVRSDNSGLTGLSTAAVDIAATNTAQLAQHLLDASPWVSRHAQLQLLELAAGTDRTEQAQHELSEAIVTELQSQLQDSRQELDKRLASLWGLCMWGDERALAVIAQQLSGTDDSLLQAACHAVSLHRYGNAKPQMEELLKHTNLQVSRAAAEGLGRIGDHASVNALLNVLDGRHAANRVWEHSICYALIELEAVDRTLESLAKTSQQLDSNRQTKSSPRSDSTTSNALSSATAQRKRIAMQVIDQLAASHRLSVDMLLDGLGSGDERYRQTASQILAKHPDWAPSYRVAIDELYQQPVSQPAISGSAESDPDDNLGSVAGDALQTIVAGWRETATVQQLMTQWIKAAPTSDPAQQQRLVALLAAYANSDLPLNWISPLAKWLEHASADDQLAIANQLTLLQLPDSAALDARLIELASSTSDEVARLQFLAALPVNAVVPSPQLEQALLSSLESDDATSDSEHASTSSAALANAAMAALQRVRLSIESGRQLLQGLPGQSARHLPVVVEAISRVGDDALDADLLQQLAHLPAARTLAEGQLINLYRARSASLQQAAQAAVTAMSQPPSDVQEKIDTVLSQLNPGDPIRGLQLFRSSKTACSGCHKLGYVGGEIGPDLTRIGSSRSRPALLEAILFPSARLEQSYQSTKILTHDGQVYNGLITQHLSPTQFTMQLSADKSIVLSTDDVERQEVSEVSIMPSGLADLLTLDELSDLIAILESAK